MAKRIVDVFEMIKVDVEHRSPWPAAAHFLDHCFQSIAKEDSVGQAAKRIMHGEVA